MTLEIARGNGLAAPLLVGRENGAISPGLYPVESDAAVIRVGVDFHDTVVSHFEGLAAYLDRVHKLRIDPDEITTLSWGRSYGAKRRRERSIMRSFWRSPEYRDPPPRPGALEGLNHISSLGLIGVITASPEDHVPLIQAWGTNQCPDILTLGVHCSYNPYERTGDKTKPEIARALGLHVFLEDSGRTAIDIAEEGIESILFRRRWNERFIREAEEAGVHIVETWDEAAYRVEQIKDEVMARMYEVGRLNRVGPRFN